MRLIDADVLMERACNLEAQALAYVGKVVNDESKIEEWKIWSAILAERTAFKHDVFDAPTIEPQRKTGHWQKVSADKYIHFSDYIYRCDQCGKTSVSRWNFCSNCGAKMEF